MNWIVTYVWLMYKVAITFFISKPIKISTKQKFHRFYKGHNIFKHNWEHINFFKIFCNWTILLFSNEQFYWTSEIVLFFNTNSKPGIPTKHLS